MMKTCQVTLKSEKYSETQARPKTDGIKKTRHGNPGVEDNRAVDY